MAHKTAATWLLDGSSINHFAICIAGTQHLVLDSEFYFPPSSGKCQWKVKSARLQLAEAFEDRRQV